ncbi:MAG: InlB B-repeat-containing protein, partial [Clostridia bacterium]|nr:InlB B-repeat-containing protein [Clostridia bacterium]
MKLTKRLLTLALAVLMIVSVLPLSTSAVTYDVLLNHGPQGWGSEAWPLQRNSGERLPLYHTRDDILNNYGMLPGYYVMNDQRVFIEWNTAYDARTGRGTGTSYYDYYDGDTSQYLYAIWGYNIQLNADGGVFPATGNSIYLSYVANYNGSNYNDPLTDYEYCFPDFVGGAPTKPGCRRYMPNGNYAYGLLTSNLGFFTWEGPGQNLTIPPTGGSYPWSYFHCVNTYRGLALEFVAIWEPSITYDANGGTGYMGVDYLEFAYDALWNYEYYTVKNCGYSKSGTYFTGWNTKPDGSGVKVAPGSTLGGQMNNSDPITLYAQWADGSTGHVHSYNSTVTTQPTCTTQGVRNYKCACGSAYNEAIPALGHNTTTYTTPATCTTEGQNVTSCTRCGAAVTTKIPALGHDYKTTTTSATCTKEGTSVQTCSRCGDSTTTTTPALGHDYTTTTTEATCTEGGKTVKTCKRCSNSFTTTTEALGHDYKTTTTYPTCTEEGKTVKSCSRCGDSTTTTTPALGHTFGGYVYNNDAVCGKDGTKTRTCISCQFKETVTAEGTATGEHLFYDYVSNNDATCTEDGTMTASCEYGCGETDTIKDAGTAKGHSFGDWTVTTEPTATSVGVETRACSACDATETREIPMLDSDSPVVAGVNNYTVTLNGISDIKEIRFAIGHYTTGSEVKAAEKNVTLDKSTVAKYTVDGVMTYDLPWVGEYTFWVRANDGSSYFIYTNVDEIDPYVESYGVKLTVKDYGEDYKDMWLAKGTFGSYNEIKASTDFKYQASVNKMNVFAKTTHDFSYTMSEPGDYTVLIRYNDGSYDLIHHTLTVDYPEFIGNGLQLTVTNIPDIKIIRTAYGHYESVAEIKAASGVRNFSNKNDIKNAESYKIQFRDEGEVTLIVEYNNGYKHVYHYNVEKKVPTFTQNGNSVTIGDLDGLYIVRYAPGKYTSSTAIKDAAGSKYAKADSINADGNIVINNLTVGTWSFCVQYDDESYNYYTINIEEDDILPCAHTWGDWVVTQSPTYVFEGEEERLCSSCGAVEIRTVAALVCTHTSWSEWATVIPATFTSEGEEVRSCLDCGTEETRTISKLVCTHSFGEWEVTVPATEETEGLETRTCTVCGETETQTIPVIVVVPTATNVAVSKAFSDNMMVQRDDTLSVWGTADSDSGKVIVEFAGETAVADVDEEGNWKATFDKTFAYSTEVQDMTVYGGDSETVIEDILIGDVYYVIGQSNVFYSILTQIQQSNDYGITTECDFDDSRNIRFFRNSNLYTADLEGDLAQGTAAELNDVMVDYGWMTPSQVEANLETNEYLDKRNTAFSALGYLFAYNMSKEVDVPVGVIEIDAAGYPLMSFAPNELAEKWGHEQYDEETGTYYYYLRTGVLNNPELKTRYVYNHLINPLKNFSTAGIIWYQGES